MPTNPVSNQTAPRLCRRLTALARLQSHRFEYHMYDTPKKSLKLTQAQAQTQTKIHRRTYPGQVTAVLEYRLEDSRSERGN